MGYQPTPRVSEEQEKIYRRRRELAGIVIAGVCVTLFVLLPLGILFKQQAKYDQFAAERTLIKICADGTRIYEWRGETMLSDFTRVKREACQ